MKTNAQYEAEQKEKRREIKEERGYITWLNDFTGAVKDFADDGYLFRPLASKELSEVDRENIRNVRILFSILQDYATANGIFPELESHSITFYMRDGEHYYRITKALLDSNQHAEVLGKNSYIYCAREDENIDKEYIEWEKVRKSNASIGSAKIFAKLNEEIANLRNQGIPDKQIAAVTAITLGQDGKLLEKKCKNGEKH